MTLSVANICINRGEKRIVSDVSFEIHPGEILAIAGPNGSGKSTILAAVSGELKCAKGDIRIADTSLDDWPLKSLAKRRGVLLQESPLTFPFKVIDVVLMGRSAHHDGLETQVDIEIAAKAIEKVGLSGFESRKYTQLSGGEKQRVHLARVLSQVWSEENLVNQSRYLLLDEPTASQDLAAQHLVLSSARHCADQGAAVLCVLHDLNQAAQYADRILLLCQGRTVALGTPQSTLTPSNLELVYGVPVRVMTHDDYPHPIVLSAPVQSEAERL